jgi:DNA polymerase-3 subunit delta'
MNIQSSNAILKILEEPPEQTLFILVTYSREKLMPTILSRTQIVGFRPFEIDEIAQYLQEKRGTAAKEALQIAALSEGSMQTALRLLKEPTSDHFVAFRDWVRLCYGKKLAVLAENADSFQKTGREAQKAFFLYALHIVRQALIWRLAGSNLIRLPEEEAEFIGKFSPFVTDQNVAEMARLLSEACYHIERNANPKIVYLDTSIKVSVCIVTA